MNKQTLITIVLAVMLVASLTVNIVFWAIWPDKTSENPVIEPVNTTTTTSSSAAPTTTTTIYKDLTAINTPYGVVKFPTSFTDVRYESTEEDGVYTLSFRYVREEEEVEAFAVHFGDEEKGSLIGYVTYNDELVPFTVTSADAYVDEDWASEEQDYFKGLMMAINDVIASVQAWDSFSE